MSSQAEKAVRLNAYNNSLLDDDPEMLDAEGPSHDLLEASPPPGQAIELESIIMRRRRPVLAIQKGKPVLEFKDDADVPLWKARLNSAAPFLDNAIPSVGRIELKGNPDFSWVGTGWLVHPRYLVSNRHVAEVFARSEGDGFIMQSGSSGEMAASIDMLQTVMRSSMESARIASPRYSMT